ncbi:MAG: hypothetical protein ACKO72_02125 [Actinomycetes bacterium]
MSAPARLRGADGATTLHTVILTLTILGIAGVVIIGVVLAVSGFTAIGLVVLGLFAVQAFYGWTLYRRLVRPAGPGATGGAVDGTAADE